MDCSEKERKYNCKIIWILYRILSVEVFNRKIDLDLIDLFPTPLLSLGCAGDNMEFRIKKDIALNKDCKKSRCEKH